MADAGHMVTDVFAIAFSLWTALQVAQSAADSATQIKNERLNALAALTNGGAATGGERLARLGGHRGVAIAAA